MYTVSVELNWRLNRIVCTNVPPSIVLYIWLCVYIESCAHISCASISVYAVSPLFGLSLYLPLSFSFAWCMSVCAFLGVFYECMRKIVSATQYRRMRAMFRCAVCDMEMHISICGTDRSKVLVVNEKNKQTAVVTVLLLLCSWIGLWSQQYTSTKGERRLHNKSLLISCFVSFRFDWIQ